MSVHAKAAELGAQSALSQRARLMLDLIVDIKNNRKRPTKGGQTAELPPDVLKLVHGSNISAVSLRNLQWDHVRNPTYSLSSDTSCNRTATTPS